MRSTNLHFTYLLTHSLNERSVINQTCKAVIITMIRLRLDLEQQTNSVESTCNCCCKHRLTLVFIQSILSSNGSGSESIRLSFH